MTAQFEAVKETLPDSLKKYNELFFLAWTTTPWTLPSNTALTIGSKIKYALISTFNQYTFKKINIVLAKDLVHKVLSGNFIEIDNIALLEYNKSKDKKIPFIKMTEFDGKDLIGVKYKQLWSESPLPYKNPENAFRIIFW